MTTRIDARFAQLKKESRSAFVTFLMAGDPDPETSLAIIKALPKAGADVIEIGMPFTDPMADGPAIQAAGLRALKAGMTLKKTLALVADFRKDDDATPLVLMGYYNPIYIYGVDKFLADAKSAGVDGLIVVDLPPEEDSELCVPAMKAGLNFIRLATPTTDDKRLPAVLANTSGFVYYVSVTGITGSASADSGAGGRSRRPHQAAYGVAGLCRFRHPHAGGSSVRLRPRPMAPWSAPRWWMPCAAASMRTARLRPRPLVPWSNWQARLLPASGARNRPAISGRVRDACLAGHSRGGHISVATLTFLTVLQRPLQRNVSKSHTRKPIFASVPLVLTFVNGPAATRYECQNRDTRRMKTIRSTK